MPVLATNPSGQLTEPFAGSVLKTETVAAAGSVIGNATALSASCGLSIVTGADDTKGVILPVAQVGLVHEVYSSQATNGLKIYPQVNSTLNGGSANSAIVIEGLSLARFVGTSATNWAAQYTTNS